MPYKKYLHYCGKYVILNNVTYLEILIVSGYADMIFLMVDT